MKCYGPSDKLLATYDLVDGLLLKVTYPEPGYDEAGNRTSLNVVGRGLSLSYDYDDIGRLWHIRRGADTFTFGYNDASRRRSLTYPNSPKPLLLRRRLCEPFHLTAKEAVMRSSYRKTGTRVRRLRMCPGAPTRPGPARYRPEGRDPLFR
jgi:hypothetical protein